ncbi:MAG: MaoC family dehydratase N-terminal domain-containing protein, partial [Anaerolineae bacterium]
KEMGSRTGDPVLARDIRRYALAIDDPNPTYYDEEAARKGKYGVVVAPPGYVAWATGNASIERRVGELTEDGFSRGAFLAIPGIPHVWTLGWVRGGEEYEFYKRVRVGDRITVRYKITDIRERESRSGRLVFITTEHRYTNQEDELLAVHRITMIGMPRPKGE